MPRELTAEIRKAGRGAQSAAFFDLDRTLLEGFSVYSFFGERITSGAMPPREMAANVAAMANYKLGRSGFSGVVAGTAQALRGVSEASFEELGEQVFRKHLLPLIYPEAKELIKAHRERGHTLAVVSSATRYQIEPVARYLGIDHVMCTRLEVKDGLFTGKVIRPTCHGEGKATAARGFAARHGVDLAQSWFYTDAIEDLPLLEAVGHPTVLNPDRELARLAAERDWPVRYFHRRSVGATEVLGTGLAYASMIPAMLAGQAVKAATGSQRSGTNLMMSAWADFAAFAVGLDIRVRGREHLWSHRPAVFVFNHQSAADALIMAKLVREDFTGVAKAEISKHPIAGPTFRAAGVVFVERSDRDKAIQALKPAVEALKKGTSLVIAPEGTRSETERLGPFKKGAFHIAMQAGVPIIPVVIHNAIEAQPKNGVLFRPAVVRVEVLPPVPTDGWRPETVDQHVAEVRALFLKALGQRDDTVAPVGAVRVEAAQPVTKATAATQATRPMQRRRKRLAGAETVPVRKPVAKGQPAARRRAGKKGGSR